MMQRQPGKYLLAFHRSMTFHTIDGKTLFMSSAEIVPVELLKAIPATKTVPALYELALTLDGERKVLIVNKNSVELRKVRNQNVPCMAPLQRIVTTHNEEGHD